MPSDNTIRLRCQRFWSSEQRATAKNIFKMKRTMQHKTSPRHVKSDTCLIAPPTLVSAKAVLELTDTNAKRGKWKNTCHTFLSRGLWRGTAPHCQRTRVLDHKHTRGSNTGGRDARHVCVAFLGSAAAVANFNEMSHSPNKNTNESPLARQTFAHSGLACNDVR